MVELFVFAVLAFYLGGIAFLVSVLQILPLLIAIVLAIIGLSMGIFYLAKKSKHRYFWFGSPKLAKLNLILLIVFGLFLFYFVTSDILLLILIDALLVLFIDFLIYLFFATPI